MSFYVQREYAEWRDVLYGRSSLEEAKKFANEVNIGDQPEALRIVDSAGTVCAWVSRNGYLPSGGLAPEPEHSLGAMIPPELAWMEGKTPGEISFIHFILRVRKWLEYGPLSTEDNPYDLYADATKLLQSHGVPTPKKK